MALRTSRLPGLATSPSPPRSTAVTPIRSIAVVPEYPLASVGSEERLKRIGEFAFTIMISILASPLILVSIVLVRMTSPGSAIYTQTRIGRWGRLFTLYKIRTMYADCESQTGPRWSLPGDPRITPVGRVLRKLHLDELPQLWNVLKGEMSLIGPRPERPEIVAKLRLSVPGYDRRHAVTPGITGFAQIHLPPDSGIRSVKNKLVYDLFYIRQRAVSLQLYILFATGLKLLGLKSLYQRKPRIPTE